MPNCINLLKILLFLIALSAWFGFLASGINCLYRCIYPLYPYDTGFSYWYYAVFSFVLSTAGFIHILQLLAGCLRCYSWRLEGVSIFFSLLTVPLSLGLLVIYLLKESVVRVFKDSRHYHLLFIFTSVLIVTITMLTALTATIVIKTLQNRRNRMQNANFVNQTYDRVETIEEHPSFELSAFIRNNINQLKGIAWQERDTAALIQVATIKSNRKIMEDDECPICFGPVLPDQMHVTHPGCNHLYHVNCLEEWMHTKLVCPMCKLDTRPALLKALRDAKKKENTKQ